MNDKHLSSDSIKSETDVAREPKTDDQIEVEREGVQAFRSGTKEDDCPYVRGRSAQSFLSSRVWWFNGYFSARNAAKFPKWFTVDELLN